MDQVDLEVMERVRQAGDLGVFPKVVRRTRQQFDLKYYDVSRRIVRMNKRLKMETGELLFEKRGHKWALTRFAFDVYGAIDLADAQRNSGNGEVKMTEFYYKGIYPVEVVPEASVDSDRQELKVRAKSHFLHTSNYSDETRIVKPGEELTVLRG